MGINLCIANSRKEINKGLELENVRLEDHVMDFIWYNRDILSPHIDIYLKLEPYDDLLLTNQEVFELQCFAEMLLTPNIIEKIDFSKEETIKRFASTLIYPSIDTFSKEEIYESAYVPKEEYLQFAQSIKMVCEKALALGKPLYSIGD